MLGACTGTPYITHWPIINGLFDSFPTVYSALEAVNSAIDYTNNLYVTTIVPDTSIPPADPNGSDGTIDASGIVTAVAGVDAAMNALSGTALQTCQTSYYIMLNHLTTEVTNLGKAGAVFGPGSPKILSGFAQRVPALGSQDALALGTDSFFANLITNDAAGDTIRASIAEFTNINVLSRGGITLKNDPNPIQAIAQSRAQNIPLTTYLSQNK